MWRLCLLNTPFGPLFACFRTMMRPLWPAFMRKLEATEGTRPTRLPVATTRRMRWTPSCRRLGAWVTVAAPGHHRQWRHHHDRRLPLPHPSRRLVACGRTLVCFSLFSLCKASAANEPLPASRVRHGVAEEKDDQELLFEAMEKAKRRASAAARDFGPGISRERNLVRYRETGMRH